MYAYAQQKTVKGFLKGSSHNLQAMDLIGLTEELSKGF